MASNFHPLSRGHLLNLQNPRYLRALRRVFFGALAADGQMVAGLSNRPIVAHITANSAGIMALGQEMKYLLGQIGVSSQFKKDGQKVAAGTVIATLRGPARAVLRAERVGLDMLARGMGVARATAKMLACLPPNTAQLCATRKGLHPLLDKKAAHIAGAWSHRLGASDAILIKENHIGSTRGGLPALLGCFAGRPLPARAAFLQVEVETPAECEALLQAAQNLPRPLGVMFDSWPAANIAPLAARARTAGLFTEASGGITAENIADYARTGVDAISVGAITTSASFADLSLRVEAASK